MKAIVLAKPGGIEELKTIDIEKPILKEGEVLVQVKAISINATIIIFAFMIICSYYAGPYLSIRACD